MSESISIQIDSIDHLVLTVRDIPIACEFYRKVLGMEVITFGDNRKALKFGRQKLNLHQAGRELEPKAAWPTPGAIDLCLLSVEPIDRVVAHLQDCGVGIELGPVQRTGANGSIQSVYIRDPDCNLVEIAYPLR
ncbi:MAG: VOC family protein [Cyanobacteria bacterium J06642_2]